MGELDETDAMLLDLNSLAIGNEKLAKSVQKSFCLHFDVIGEFRWIVKRMNLTIHIQFSDAPRNKLSVLRTKV